MLSARTATILKFIVEQYITRAVPVPSQAVASDSTLGVSPATIRNEMAYLEHEGYITRPHTSAGCIPSDKGYRFYVETLDNIELPLTQQHLISHLFQQAEREVERWLSLTATLLAQLVQNVAVVTMPKPADCKFKHIELVSLQDLLGLLVLVLQGAKVKQQLVLFDQLVPQPQLTAISNKLNELYSGLNCQQISAKDAELTAMEKQITDYLLEIMRTEDEQEYEEPHLDGLQFILNQPEFAHGDRVRPLLESVEHRNLLKIILPQALNKNRTQIIIGKENKAEAFQDYSMVISRYGLPDEASGTIGVVGPTRMPYAHTIPTVGYLSSVLNRLVAALYGKENKT